MLDALKVYAINNQAVMCSPFSMAAASTPASNSTSRPIGSTWDRERLMLAPFQGSRRRFVADVRVRCFQASTPLARVYPDFPSSEGRALALSPADVRSLVRGIRPARE